MLVERSRARLMLEDMRSFDRGTMGRLRECNAASGPPTGGSITFVKLVSRSDTLGLTSQVLHTSPFRAIRPNVIVPSLTPFRLKVAWKARMKGTPKITIGPMFVSSSKSVIAGTHIPDPKPDDSAVVAVTLDNSWESRCEMPTRCASGTLSPTAESSVRFDWRLACISRNLAVSSAEVSIATM